MNSNQIRTESLEEVKARVAHDLRYYSKLVERLQKIGVGPTDPVYREAEGARAKMQDLHMALHYATMSRGVGKDARPDSE